MAVDRDASKMIIDIDRVLVLTNHQMTVRRNRQVVAKIELMVGYALEKQR